MPSTALKRRRNEDSMKGKAPKKTRRHVKKQKFYHSSSDDDDDDDMGAARDAPRDCEPVSLESCDGEPQNPTDTQHAKPQPAKLQPTHTAKTTTTQPHPPTPTPMATAKDDIMSSEDEADDSEASDDSKLSKASTNSPTRKVRKRNDPEAFAASLSKILNTKLSSQKRSEPILSRSKAAQDANKSLADLQLTHKAQRQLLAEKRAAQDKGRVKDVLGFGDPSVSTAAATAKEKELRRTAQKGVIKLFNAVRAAQVKGEQAERESRQKGLVGLAKRQEKVQEMSKQGFLDMITGGAKKDGSVEA